jgi:glycosyltransferase involved in cell wall biosynthesis
VSARGGRGEGLPRGGGVTGTIPDGPRTENGPRTGDGPARAGETRARDRVWIAWESQRRSLNLSRRVAARLLLCIDEDKGLLRYPLSALRTLRELRRLRGGIVFVQNPSMVLAALAGLARRFFGYFLVVDRHSNFTFLAQGRPDLKRRLSALLSDFTLRNADVTIVTNSELAAHVASRGGRPFVLPDPFPEIPASDFPAGAAAPSADPARPKEILFVSSWAFDEPIAQAIEACRRLRGKVIIRITGRPKGVHAALLADAPDNFIPTGFVPDEAYFALMARSDAVMAVTDRAATLVCGAYEAAVMGKPMILGDTRALREYFHLGAVYTDSSPADLTDKIETLVADLPRYAGEVRLLLETRGAQWERRLRDLESLLPGGQSGMGSYS